MTDNYEVAETTVSVLRYIDEVYGIHLIEHPVKEEGGYIAENGSDGKSSRAYGMLVREGKNSRFLPHRLKTLEETFVKAGGNGDLLIWAYDLESGKWKGGSRFSHKGSSCNGQGRLGAG